MTPPVVAAPALHHVALRAADLETSAAFYRDVLGLPELRRHRDERGALRSVWLDAAGIILMIELSLRSPGPTEGSGHLLALRVDDLELWERWLGDCGVPVADRTPFTLYAADPDGHRVGLSTYRPGAASDTP